ncbi:MAG: hydrogenase maturation protease [candidate division WOR-3 bacterium]|jgi:hydrogenase maturation protease
MKRILVYGIGNPYRCDDAVGIKVAEQLSKKLKHNNIEIKWGTIDGVAILDEIVGYDQVIFIDSVKTGKVDPGTICKIDPLSFSNAHSFSSHGINFVAALEFGKRFNLKMPEKTDIYAIEIEDNDTFSEECTPKVSAAISELVAAITEELS